MDDIMQDNVEELEAAVVGHKIVSVIGNEITLDNGKTVTLVDTDDCCAYTELEAFLLNVELIDHMITGVKASDNYTTWHIYADMGDVLKLTVGWSEGSGYYGYGFNIVVR